MSEQPKDPRNAGHGWVTERPDGMKAKCGGPGLCVACKTEKEAIKPPALGGEVKVLGYSVKGNRYAIRLTKGELLELHEGYSGDALIELVDRAHVAQLQADLASANADKEAYGQNAIDLRARVDGLQAEVERLNALIVELAKDKERIDSIEANYWDLRHSSSPIADTGDHSTSIEIVGHWMDKPHERVIGENYNENLRAAIDQAMSADAYPPERPEYPEIDAALAEGKDS